MSTPRASIVMSLYGNSHLTERCLASLEADVGDELGRGIELVLVDNGSTDDTPELLERWSDRAVTRTLHPNQNYAGGANAAAEAASGEILIFVNNDIEVFPGTVARLLEEMEDETVGGVGIRLLYPDGTLQHAGVVWHQFRRSTLRPLHLFRHLPGDFPAARATVDLDAVTGAVFAIRREDFIANGCYDRAYANGYEDMDVCLRLRVAGKRIVYRGDIAALHHEGVTRGRGTGDAPNFQTFMGRWGSMLEDDAEMVRSLFDCVWDPGFDQHPFPPGDHPEGSLLSVEGFLAAPSSAGLEGIALLRLLEILGLEPAARSWQPQTCIARLEEAEAAVLAAAQRRPRHLGVLAVHVPEGGLLPLPPAAGRLLRVGRELPPHAADAAAIWAASRTAVDELAAAGADPARVAHLPPHIPEAAAGPGGEGVLAVLPAHDPRACRAVLEALARASAGRVRLLPTVAGTVVSALARELLPDAELLGPLTNERELAGLAGACDAVVALDAADSFDRVPLLAAATGTAIVCLRGGPAADVVSSAALVDDASGADAIAAALAQALEGAGERAARNAEVTAACGPHALGARVLELLAELNARRAPSIEAIEATTVP